MIGPSKMCRHDEDCRASWEELGRRAGRKRCSELLVFQNFLTRLLDELLPLYRPHEDHEVPRTSGPLMAFQAVALTLRLKYISG